MKKGFTLIEIIVVIALISVIGTGSVVGINYITTKNEDKKIQKTFSQFDNALEVYLSTHEEIYKNLNDNVEGAVITLETLKNEGLIEEGIKHPITNETIDYKDNYYVLSDAVILSDNKETELNCDGQVSLEVIKSWGTLKDKVDASDILYICPKNNEETVNESKKEIEILKKRLETLEYAISLTNMGGNSYVKFDVDNNKDYISWNDSDIWQIVSSNNGLKLMYNQPVLMDVSNQVDIFKSKLLNNIEASSSCDYQVTGSGDVLLTSNEEVKTFDIRYYGKYCNTAIKKSRSCYVYNNIVYCRIDDSWASDIRRKVINPNEKCSDSTVYESGYFYEEQGTINEYIMNNCYINEGNYNDFKPNINHSIKELPSLDTNESYDFGGLLGVNYYSMFTDGTSSSDDNSIKNILYNKINSNLKKSVKESTYYKFYNYGAEGQLAINAKSEYKDKLGTITYNEAKALVESNVSSLLGKSILLGIVQAGSGFSSADYLLNFNSTDWDNGEKISSRGYEDKLIEIGTSTYYPTIKLSTEYQIIMNYDEYPIEYKNKCGDSKLGSIDCPYLIKIGEYYSDGNKIGG